MHISSLILQNLHCIMTIKAYLMGDKNKQNIPVDKALVVFSLCAVPLPGRCDY